jgi:uncharacterized membrane protein YhaH (DUF805 family)
MVLRYLGFLLFGFNGRIGRRAFWIGVLITYLASVGLALVGAVFDAMFGTEPIRNLSFFAGLYPISTIAACIPFWCGLAIAVKRLHDRDKGAKWLIIQIIPILGSLWLILEMGALPGTTGPNDWGDDPRSPASPAAS